MTRRVAVIGASGFVGSHVVVALENRGAHVHPVRAPRLVRLPHDRAVNYLATELKDSEVVVNAAGIAFATGSHHDLMPANRDLPQVLSQVTATLGVRLVHVSSAAVQGRRPILDASPQYAAFSPYSVSKAAGEQIVLSGKADVCVYRPPGVHGTERAITRSLVKVARSAFSSVSAPGTQNAPQALISNVADAIAFLALYDKTLPPIVHHPSEGLTVETLLTLLSGRIPTHVPRLAAQGVHGALRFASRVWPRLAGYSRRLEVLWFGQGQAPSWLSAAGWTPVEGLDGWNTLGDTVHRQLGRTDSSTRQEKR